MRPPRKFLILIIMLLLINVLFFSIWYPWGGRDYVRNYLTNMIGDMLDSEFSLGDLHLSDRQILAQDISFARADSLIILTAESIRIRYNLYKFLLSGFKYQNVVSSIEIIKPIAQINYRYVSKEDKGPKNAFKIPDLSQFFSRLSLEEGKISAAVYIPLQIKDQGLLEIEESFEDIELRIDNHPASEISFSAVSSLGGSFAVTGRIEEGRIDLAEAKIAHYRPLYIAHPDLEDFRTELDLNVSYAEPADLGEVAISADLQLSESKATVIKQYPVNLPLITLTTDGNSADISIFHSSIASSSLSAELKIDGIRDEMRFDGSQASFDLLLSDIIPDLSGRVQGQLRASGSIKDPYISLDADSRRFAYRNWAFNDIALQAEYSDDTAKLSILEGRWENQSITLSASYQPKTKVISAELETNPLNAEHQNLLAAGKLSVEGILLNPYPLLNAQLRGIDIKYNDLNLQQLQGYARVAPTEEAWLFDTELEAADGFSISAVGDILDRFIALNADLRELDVAAIYSNEVLRRLSPCLSGPLSAIMHNNMIWLKSGLDTALKGEYDYRADLDLLGSVDLNTMEVTAALKTVNGSLNGEALNLDLNMNYADNEIKVWHLKLEDFLNLSGRINLKDIYDSELDLALTNLDHSRLISYYDELELLIPEYEDINLFANYNRAQDGGIDVWLNLRELDLLSIIPVNLNLNLKGSLAEIQIAGDLKSGIKPLLSLSGVSSILPQVDLSLKAEMQDLKMQEIMIQAPGQGSFSGMVECALKNATKPDRQMTIATDMVVRNLKFGDFSIDLIDLQAEQQSEALIIDTLYAYSPNLFEATAHGALDYNAIQNLFYNGNRVLDVAVKGELFPWLKNVTDYIIESRGSSSIALKIGTNEDQFMVYAGELDIKDGYVHLKDQVEPMRNIEIQGIFDDNRLILKRGQFQMGNGIIYIDNIFDTDDSEHLMLSFIDLGYLRLMIEEPGLQVTIPSIAPPNTLSNIALRGQDSRYATIRGPFDDMKIEAYVLASNLDILYPPGADNLLNLIMSVRGSGKKPESDPVLLPFHLDLIVTIGENVRYVTYPTNLYLVPGGFMHLVYDGTRFIIQEANINSERGSIDFFGTVFQVDNIAINMIDQQDILSVNGSFYKRTSDGSTITLSVTSSPDYDKSFFDRLQINLTSDNPADQNVTQVLSRLRYNQSMDDVSQDQQNNLLQDEALGMIGGNLNSAFLTPFFYPAENWIRRTLKLDSFSIYVGFIQNLFTEYSANPTRFADMADMSDLSSDISQFSSSILLNNLTISMSKYIGYRMFLDYKLTLQEATDLQQKTKILVSHDSTLRMNLPRQYRLGYTLNYSPEEDGFSHEILLQKSFRFWGL